MIQLDLDVKADALQGSAAARRAARALVLAAFLPKRVLYRILFSAFVAAVAVYVWRRR